MTDKKFVIISLLLTTLFLLTHLFIWKQYTEMLFTGNVGDLSRLGYSHEMAINKGPAIIDLPKKHISWTEYKNEKIDILVLGDSFAYGIAGGKNPSFMDHIASYNGLNVLFMRTLEKNKYIETVAALINSGWIKKYRPKYVLIESANKSAIGRFSGNKNFARAKPLSEIEEKREKAPTSEKQKLKFINTGNMKFLFYNFMYNFSDNAAKKVYRMELNKELFSVGDNTILVLNEDIKVIKKTTKQNIIKLNNNMNTLAEMLKEHGARLAYLPIVDKYDLYSAYIKNNRHKKNHFFNYLRPLPKDYIFIDSKDILSKSLAEGEVDLFYPDDTHWSWKAPEIIFKTVRFE